MSCYGAYCFEHIFFEQFIWACVFWVYNSLLTTDLLTKCVCNHLFHWVFAVLSDFICWLYLFNRSSSS